MITFWNGLLPFTYQNRLSDLNVHKKTKTKLKTNKPHIYERFNVNDTTYELNRNISLIYSLKQNYPIKTTTTKKKVKTIIDIVSQLQGFLSHKWLNDSKHRFQFTQYSHKYILLSIQKFEVN